MTAKMDGPFVIFLIGMRINKFWKFGKWWPVASAMPKMIKELMANKSQGLLHAETWFGRTTIMVQYWESFEKLEAYARNRNASHLPAWQQFNKNVGSNGDVGIWHETYLIEKGNYECIYNNMPRFGLGKVGEFVEAKGNYHNAKDRLVASREAI